MNQENWNIRLDEDLTDQMTVNKNLTQEIIVTNTDKITILLNEHHKVIKKRTEWLSPLGIFISVFATLLTAKFDEIKFGVSPELWKSIFIVVCLITFVYSVYLIIIALCYRKQGTTSEFIKKLKSERQGLPQIEPLKKEIIIHSAKYGVTNNFVDLTEKISDFAAENILEFKVNNSLVDGKDPMFGTPKSIEIIYSVNGKHKMINEIEGATVKIE